MRITLEAQGNPSIFHAGELEAHQRFDVQAQAHEMQRTVANHLSADNARFMAGAPFFLISARETDGSILTQMLARVSTALGTYPLLAFADTQTFFFLLANTEGERLLKLTHQSRHKVGMIFVDFARSARFRVNGELQQAADDALPDFECPAGHRLMEMRVEQAFSNCPSRVVRLKFVPRQ